MAESPTARGLDDGILPHPPLANSIASTARRIGIGRTKVFELIRDGRLAAVRCGRRTLIPEAALQDFLSSLPRVHRKIAHHD
jgi:excisionase family DNA binding protein